MKGEGCLVLMMSSMACMARPPCFSHFHAVYASRRVPLCGRLPLPTKLHRYHAARSRIVSQARDRGQEGASKRDIRVYVGGQQLMDGSTVSFAPSQGHYLEKVMRVMEGSQVKVFNGCDGEWWCRIDHFDKKGARGTVIEQRHGFSAGSDVWLVFAPVKGDATEAIVQKATELGVRGILPVSTQRTIIKSVKLERLQTIAVEASEQCERLDVPDLVPLQSLSKLLSSWPSDRRLIVCDETRVGERGSWEALRALQGQEKFAMLVGPEGGWSEDELSLFSDQQAVACHCAGRPGCHSCLPQGETRPGPTDSASGYSSDFCSRTVSSLIVCPAGLQGCEPLAGEPRRLELKQVGSRASVL